MPVEVVERSSLTPGGSADASTASRPAARQTSGEASTMNVAVRSLNG
jgi:hypothetical protein